MKPVNSRQLKGKYAAPPPLKVGENSLFFSSCRLQTTTHPRIRWYTGLCAPLLGNGKIKQGELKIRNFPDKPFTIESRKQDGQPMDSLSQLRFS